MEQINLTNIFLLAGSFMLIGATNKMYLRYKKYIFGDVKKSLAQIHILIFLVVYIFISILFSIDYERFLENGYSIEQPSEIWYAVIDNAVDPIYKLEDYNTFPEYFDAIDLSYFNPIEPIEPEEPIKEEAELDQSFNTRLDAYEAELEQYNLDLEQYNIDKQTFDQNWDEFNQNNVINTPTKMFNDIMSHPELMEADGYTKLADVQSFQMLFNSNLWQTNQVKISNRLSANVLTSDFIVPLRLIERDAFWLPSSIALMIPVLFFTIALVRFVYLPLKTPKIYLEELRNINRFTAFLNYNVKFNNNEKNLLEESLRGINEDYFFEVAGTIFTSETVESSEKYEEVTSIFNFQFLSLYFSLFQVMLNEGITDEGLASLELAQYQGEKYYKSIDRLYQAKKSALNSVRLVIIVIGVAVPLLTKSNVTDLYLIYIYGSGYTMTILFYIVILSLFAIATRTYSDNKIIKREGRYL